MSFKTLAILLFVSLPTFAQTTAPMLHNQEEIIDGSKNPELIADSTAWRLWMLSVTAKDPQHPELDQKRQDAYLRQAGYEDDELPVMRGQLYSFRAAYDAMIAEHNRAEAANQHPSHAALNAKRDALVKATIDGMLAAKNHESVETFVKGQKRFMRIPKTEAVR